MGICRNPLALLVVLACPAITLAQPAQTDYRTRAAAETLQLRTKTASSMSAARLVPIENLPQALREKVKRVLNQPSLVTHAPPEEFTAVPKLYRWLLDHPDRAAAAWQRVGIPCQPIIDRGNGRFSWADDQGSEIVWFPLADGADVRIWYAEGQVHPGALLPTIPVRAVVVLRHRCPNSEELTKIQHEVDVFCHADSRAANLAYRIFGPSTDRMAQQAAEQLLTFFGTISQYVGEHPEQMQKLLVPAKLAKP